MKKLFLCCFCFLLFSCKEKINCDGKVFDNYDMYVDYSLNQLKSPVVLKSIRLSIDKRSGSEPDTLYSIIVKDSEKKIKYYNYNSDLANIIGESYNIGDTIR